MFKETNPDIAGRYRGCLVRIGSYNALHCPDVKKLMQSLLTYIPQAKEHPVEIAARTHYRFEKIRPSGDGNGRIGRLLMNHILWQNKYTLPIIERKKRRAYDKVLEKNEERFVRYSLEDTWQHIKKGMHKMCFCAFKNRLTHA